MKKLFTTILMMGVALCSWASYTAEYDDGTKILTVNYVDDGNSNLNVNDLIKEHMRKAETLVLTGDWANKDLSTIGNLVGRLIKTDGPDANPNKKVFLDLSACSNMRSKVVPAEGEYSADIDWVTTEHKFLPDPNNPETVTVTGTATKVSKFYESWGAEYTGNTDLLEQHDDGLWYEPNTNWNGKTKKDVFVDEKGNELTDVTENPDGTFSYSYTKTLDSSLFKFSDGNFSNNENYLGGIAFPNHADFNYIPEGFSTSKLKTSLSTVVFGSYTEWIGAEAFAGCNNLTNPKYQTTNGTAIGFPATMKVFGGDSFQDCFGITKVDLSVLPKIQIVDYMAFGATSNGNSQLAEFILPTSDNTSLKYFANYVIRGTKVTSLDFTHCLGIKNFAHDGKATFGEFSPNWTLYWTFYNCPELTSVILPPNLSYLTESAFNTCPKLQSVTFSGRADYDKTDNCAENKLNNPLVIDKEAFKDLKNLTSVTFSDNLTEIHEAAFQATGLTEVHIPASVQVIGVHAFQESKSLSVVYFDEIADDCKPCKHARTVIAGEHRKTDANGDYVYTNQQAVDPNTGEPLFDDNGDPIYEIAREGDGDGAFFHCPVTDVYINAVDAEIICENKAFDYNITFGQTNPDASFGTLHYPEGEEEKYVNLQHYLTDEIANTPGLFQAWLQAHYNFATKPNNNGWHEFINSGPSSLVPDTIYNSEDGDVILRTYSDHYARIVPNGIKAYIVKNVALNADGNYELTLQSLRVIPAETGVILYGQPNANAQGGGKTLAMTAVEYAPENGYPLRRDYWDMLATELTTDQRQSGLTEPDAVRMKNYLMPIIDNGKIRNATTEGVFSEDDLEDADFLTVRPYDKENGQVTFRNFALNRFNTTKNLSKKDEFKNLAADDANYAGFFRILKGTYPSGYAYLHLSAEDYDDPQGAECLVIEDEFYSYEYKGSTFTDFKPLVSLEANPNRYWQYAEWEGKVKDWGVRNPDIFNLPKPGEGSVVKYLGELEEEADGIVKLVVPANESGDFFNLQGVKVTNPTKGVYVRNGKKVIIK